MLTLVERYAAAILGTTKDETCIIGDRMDTDILAGTYAQIDPGGCFDRLLLPGAYMLTMV